MSKRAKKRSRQSKEQRLWVWTQEKLTLSLYYYSPNLKYFTTVPVPPLAHYSFLEQEPARRLPNDYMVLSSYHVQPMWVNLQWLLLHSQPDLPLCLMCCFEKKDKSKRDIIMMIAKHPPDSFLQRRQYCGMGRDPWSSGNKTYN